MINIESNGSGDVVGTIDKALSGLILTGVAQSMRGTVFGRGLSDDEFYDHYKGWSNGYLRAVES
jgi:hypothetical protein